MPQEFFTAIESAHARIKPYLYPTPLIRCPWLEEKINAPVFAKLENLQRTGSFKMRGATNALLQLDAAVRNGGIVTASAGNHGLGVAQATQLLGGAVTVFVSQAASPLKMSKLRQLGAHLIQQGADYDEADAIGKAYAQEKNLPFIHAYEQDEVIAGQGTVGLELLEELSQPMCVVVPVGGGGLISGMALALKTRSSQSQIIGVQSEASPATVRALALGKVVDTPIADSIADGLTGRFASEKLLPMIQTYCDDVMLVQESSIGLAKKEFYFHQGWRVEGTAAVGAAAILENKIHSGGRPIVLIITGGNIADDLFGRVICEQ